MPCHPDVKGLSANNPVARRVSIEKGDRAAVRWQLTATYNGEPFQESIIAICRFEEGRIAEDWGIPILATLP
jgi:ketosteroid isomerase-like protein